MQAATHSSFFEVDFQKTTDDKSLNKCQIFFQKLTSKMLHDLNVENYRQFKDKFSRGYETVSEPVYFHLLRT